MVEGWQVRKLGSFIDFKNGLNADKSDYGSGIKFVNVMDIFANTGLYENEIIGSVSVTPKAANDYSVEYGDILFNRTSETPEDIAVSAVYLDNTPITFGGFVIRGRQFEALLEAEYSQYAFSTDEIRREFIRRGQGAVRANIGQHDLAQVEIQIPPIFEQRRIAEILRTWDEAIETLEALQLATNVRKSSIFRELFEQEFENPEGLVRAKFLFEPVSERGRTDLPLLAVMQEEGIVRRDELERRVTMPNGDISNYKVVRPGDFVISLRSFEGGLEYSEVTGLVSPAYTVLRPVTEINGEYYRQFFKSRSFIGRLDNLIFGIRDGKQIAFRDFGDMPLPNPELDKQTGYAAVMKTLNDEVSLYLKRIDALQRQKRGLMQKLLTGEWRVDASKANIPTPEKEIAHG